MVRKKPADAEKEFRTALAGSDKPDPAIEVRLGAALRDQTKYDEAVALFDKVMATPDVLPQVRQYAQAERVRTLQKKGVVKPADGAAPAAAPATPATPPAPTSPPPAATPKP
jgi:Tfp pilus assembly protein PilF